MTDQIYTAILWLDGRRVVDDIMTSYSSAKEKLDSAQQHHMDAYGKRVSDFDRMIEKSAA